MSSSGLRRLVAQLSRVMLRTNEVGNENGVYFLPDWAFYTRILQRKTPPSQEEGLTLMENIPRPMRTLLEMRALAAHLRASEIVHCTNGVLYVLTV